MHAYGFKIDDDQYYILAESVVKAETIQKQGFDNMRFINDEIRKRYGEGNTYSVPFGTIFDEGFNVVSSPEVTEVDFETYFDILNEEDDEYTHDSHEYTHDDSTDDEEDFTNKFAIVDATFIHLYRLGDRVMLGTRNSWDISSTKDLYGELTYGKAFNSCLKRMGLDVSQLPNGSYAFSHPLLHLTTNSYRVYSFTNTEINGVSLEFDECDVDDNHIYYNPLARCFTIVETEGRQYLHSMLYDNRWRFRRDANNETVCDELSMVNCMLHYQCNATPGTKRYVKNHSSLNDYASYCLNFVTSVIDGIYRINPNATQYHGVDIPDAMNKKRGVAVPKFYRFWQKVLANSYAQEGNWSMNFSKHY